MKIPERGWRCFILVLLAGISIGLLCGIFQWFAPPPPEPQYQGKKLTDWAKEIDQLDFFRAPAFQQHQERSERAIAAIRQMGTNAFPVALDSCAANDSWLKKTFEGWAERYNDGVWPDQRHFPIQIKSADEKRFEGVNIILALGSAAKPAIPSLIQLLQSKDADIADDVMRALPGVGTNAVPPLVELLNSANQDARIRAAVVLGDYFGSQAHAAVPVLLQCLASRDQTPIAYITRVHALHALCRLESNVPVMRDIIFFHPSLILTNALDLIRTSHPQIKPLAASPNVETNSTSP
jgi:hypothetical protein